MLEFAFRNATSLTVQDTVISDCAPSIAYAAVQCMHAVAAPTMCLTRALPSVPSRCAAALWSAPTSRNSLAVCGVCVRRSPLSPEQSVRDARGSVAQESVGVWSLLGQRTSIRLEGAVGLLLRIAGGGFTDEVRQRDDVAANHQSPDRSTAVGGETDRGLTEGMMGVSTTPFEADKHSVTESNKA